MKGEARGLGATFFFGGGLDEFTATWVSWEEPGDEEEEEEEVLLPSWVRRVPEGWGWGSSRSLSGKSHSTKVSWNLGASASHMAFHPRWTAGKSSNVRG